jgi:phospholipase/carboxylesterase
MRKTLSLSYLIKEPSQPSAGSPPLLLLLHGLGSSERDLIGLAPELDGRFYCVSARAAYTLEAGSYAWFHTRFTAEGPIIEPEEAEQSRLGILRFIDEALETFGLDAKQVYLMGFSQGAIMSLSVALTRPDKVAGVVAMSGRILPEVLPRMAAPDQLRGLPLFVAHGTADGVLPIKHGRASRDLLSRLPVKLSYREYPVGHEVTQESLNDIRAWLSGRLGSHAT